jgi:hypothetical protein
MALVNFLNKTVTVKRKSGSTSDGYGGTTKTWTTITTSLSCRIYGVRGGYKVQIEGDEYEITQKMMTESDADVLRGDKIIDGTAQYIVAFVNPVSTAQTVHHKEMGLSRLGG